MRFSASSAQRTELCPASAVMAPVEHDSEDADVGSALHEHLALRVTHGVDYAVEQLDETLARWNVGQKEAVFLRSRLMKFEWSPPPGALVEIRLALMPDGTVRRVPIDQRYLEGAVMTGQFDVLWAEPEPLRIDEATGEPVCPEGSVLWVSDFKGGLDSWVPTIETNFQASIYTFLSARWTRARSAMPAIIFPGPGQGEWDVPQRPWGEQEIAAAGERIRAMVDSVSGASELLARGELPVLREGRHCEFCPARHGCPAKVALLRSAIAEDGHAVPFAYGTLTADDAVRLAQSLGQLEQFARRAKEALQEHVRQRGPIPIGDGLFWGPRPQRKTKILAAIARPILEAGLGEHANTAFEISGASIERAVTEQLESSGSSRGVAPRVRQLYAQIGEEGGLLSSTGERWGVHRPKAEGEQDDDIDGDAPPPARPVVNKVAPSNDADDGAVVRFRTKRRGAR
jgi:hypothetical protein